MKIIEKYLKSEFIRNVFTLFTGASFAQFIPIIVAPILSRIYLPENFGEIGVILSVVGIFSIIATFQYESAIMLPKKDEDAFNILILAIFLTAIISLLSFFITWIFANQIAEMLNSKSFIKWVFIIPFFVFLTGLYNSLNIWASRKKQFKRLAFRQVAQTTMGAGTKLLLGWLKYFNSGLIWGTIVGQFTSTGALALMTFKDSKRLFACISLKRIKENAIKYQNFPKYTMWQGFFDLINASGVIFIISSFYGMTVVGLYSFTLGLLLKPTKMIGQAVAQVFYQDASKKVANNEAVYNDVRKLIINLGKIGLLIFLPFIIAGPYIFSFIFGGEWREAGVIAQVLSPLLFSRFIFSPITVITNVIGKQRSFLFISLIYNIFVPLFLFIFVHFNIELKNILLFISIFVTIYVLFVFRWLRKVILKLNLTNDRN